MKIYMITCNNAYNYGAVLQAYALQKYLEDRGHDAVVIDYFPPYLRKISKKYRKNIGAILARKLLYAPDYRKSRIAFGQFCNQYLKETEKTYHSMIELKELPKADLYIAGSDQIWNPYIENGLDRNYYLAFTQGKKVAYAASVGCDKVEKKYDALYRKRLKDFSIVTVREKNTCEYLNSIGIAADYVVDPVFLLDNRRWDRLCNFTPNEKYIVVYALHHVQKIYDYARNLSKTLGVKMYVISVEIKEKRRHNDRFFWNPSVNEYLGLVKNAEAVVTNSFHGASFGMIFHKPLHLFDTEENDNRLKNLISLFRLEDRVVSLKSEHQLQNTVAEEAKQLIKMETARSKDILDGILGE